MERLLIGQRASRVRSRTSPGSTCRRGPPPAGRRGPRPLQIRVSEDVRSRRASSASSARSRRWAARIRDGQVVVQGLPIPESSGLAARAFRCDSMARNSLVRASSNRRRSRSIRPSCPGCSPDRRHGLGDSGCSRGQPVADRAGLLVRRQRLGNRPSRHWTLAGLVEAPARILPRAGRRRGVLSQPVADRACPPRTTPARSQPTRVMPPNADVVVDGPVRGRAGTRRPKDCRAPSGSGPRGPCRTTPARRRPIHLPLDASDVVVTPDHVGLIQGHAGVVAAAVSMIARAFSYAASAPPPSGPPSAGCRRCCCDSRPGRAWNTRTAG